ncbi:hypothetical protein B0H10DRAFT_2059272 [Mycena sp. CBHHK59/15]|nr:hypothetical protein B0H10DRAFT_2059272 [Mycena sp. CBHHK59/15]
MFNLVLSACLDLLAQSSLESLCRIHTPRSSADGHSCSPSLFPTGYRACHFELCQSLSITTVVYSSIIIAICPKPAIFLQNCIVTYMHINQGK